MTTTVPSSTPSAPGSLERFELYIDGRFGPADSGETFTSFDPFAGRSRRSVPVVPMSLLRFVVAYSFTAWISATRTVLVVVRSAVPRLPPPGAPTRAIVRTRPTAIERADNMSSTTGSRSSAQNDTGKPFSDQWWEKERREDARLKRVMDICRGC